MIINKTPHDIHIYDEQGSNILKTYITDGNPIRVQQNIDKTGIFCDEIELTRTVFGKVENLPEQIDGVYYIVSQIVKSAAPHRFDLLVPSNPVRDANGNIIGCKNFSI